MSSKKPTNCLLSLFALALSLCLTYQEASGQADGPWTPIGPNGGAVFSLLVDPVNNGVVYAGAYFGGMYKTLDAGLTWSHISSPFLNSTVSAIATDGQRPDTLYAGVTWTSRDSGFSDAEAGVYKSEDGGSTWTIRNDGLTDKIVQAVAIDPFNPNILLAASESGLFRSVDAAATWSEITDGAASIQGAAIAFDSNVPGLVYVATVDTRGVLRSMDSGATWQPYGQGLGGFNAVSIAVDHSTGTAYAVTGFGSAFKRAPGAQVWANISSGLPGAGFLLPDPTNSDKLYAATVDGIYTSIDGGRSWDPSLQSSTLDPIVIAAGDSGFAVYVGTAGGPGLVSSYDGGATWLPTNAGLQNLFIGGLATVPTPDGSLIYAATTGVYYGSAESPYWGFTSNFDKIVNDIQAHPVDIGTLFLGALKDGVWKSTDFGLTWQQSSNGIVPAKIHDIAQSPLDPFLLYAATSEGYFVSPDHGATWGTKFVTSTVNLPATLSVAVDPVDPFAAYFGGIGTIYKTTDGGAEESGTVVLPANGLPYGVVTDLETPQEDRVFAVTDGRLFLSVDGGTSFVLASLGVVDEVLAVEIDPQNNEVLYLGTSGGVYKSEDGGSTWAPSDIGLPPAFVISLAVDPSNPQLVYAGTTERLYKSKDGGGSWSDASTGLPAGAVLRIHTDSTDSQVARALVQGQGIYKTTNGAATWLPVEANGIPAAETTAIASNVFDADVLYAGVGTKGVYTSVDGGGNWFASSEGMSLWIRRIAIHPLTPTTMYAAALSNGLFKSTDGGVSWTNVGLADTYIMDVVTDPVNPDVLYVATPSGIRLSADGGTSWQSAIPEVFVMALDVNPVDTSVVYAGAAEGGGMLRSTNGGADWTPINNGLTDRSIFAVAIDPVRPDTVYAGSTSSGVFVSEDAGANWAPLSGGMFNKFVLKLAIDSLDHRVIYAATEGGGIFMTVRP